MSAADFALVWLVGAATLFTVATMFTLMLALLNERKEASLGARVALLSWAWPLALPVALWWVATRWADK